ncbi:MAG: hypothetical protein FWG10_12585 [Eubacteriaceae bacterium]|nr:hypothetical protein [Eubacteriaceae bacterium]
MKRVNKLISILLALAVVFCMKPLTVKSATANQLDFQLCTGLGSKSTTGGISVPADSGQTTTPSPGGKTSGTQIAWGAATGYWRSTLIPSREDNAVAANDRFVGFFQEEGALRFEYGLYRSSYWIGGEVTAAVSNKGGKWTQFTVHIPATPASEMDEARPERWETIYIHELDNMMNIKIESLGGEWHSYVWGGYTLEEAFNRIKG